MKIDIFLLITIGCASFAYVWVEVSPLMNWIRAFQVKNKVWIKYDHSCSLIVYPRRIKPFDCMQCMSFWSALAISFFYYQIPVIQSILTASVTVMLISVFIIATKRNVSN